MFAGAAIGANLGVSAGSDIGDSFDKKHTGGMVGDSSKVASELMNAGVYKGHQEIPIMALDGEGVLSHDGMEALGGEQTLNSLNRGHNIGEIVNQVARDNGEFHSGGVVGGNSTKTYDPKAASTSGSNSGGGSVDNSSSFTANVEVKGEGASTDRGKKKLAKAIAKELDSEFAKMAKDRKSKFKKTVNSD